MRSCPSERSGTRARARWSLSARACRICRWDSASMAADRPVRRVRPVPARTPQPVSQSLRRRRAGSLRGVSQNQRPRRPAACVPAGWAERPAGAFVEPLACVIHAWRQLEPLPGARVHRGHGRDGVSASAGGAGARLRDARGGQAHGTARARVGVGRTPYRAGRRRRRLAGASARPDGRRRGCGD